MAWRIDESVIRGEIDNRVRGRVTGRIWFVGREAPVELDLAGDAWRDLAGRRLEFVNPAPAPGDLARLAVRQTGVIGDCTASRKVKVPEIPMSQIGKYYAAKKPWPWHWGNSLYLEWFSNRNGRVVIESSSFQLTIAPEIAWDMTPSEEKMQRGANAEAMGGFMARRGEAIQVDPSTAGEQMDGALPESDEDRPDDEKISGLTGECAVGSKPRHPVAERAFESQLRFRQKAEQRGWLRAGVSDDYPVLELVMLVRDAERKIAGALGGRDWPPLPIYCEDAIERLRIARGHFDHALLLAAYCEQGKYAEAAWLSDVQREINVLAFECAKLVAELHARMRGETD